MYVPGCRVNWAVDKLMNPPATFEHAGVPAWMLMQGKGLKIAQNNAGYQSAAAFLHVLHGKPRLLPNSNIFHCLLSWFTSMTGSGAAAFFLTLVQSERGTLAQLHQVGSPSYLCGSRAGTALPLLFLHLQGRGAACWAVSFHYATSSPSTAVPRCRLWCRRFL